MKRVLLSVDDSQIRKMLEKFNVTVTSEIKYDKITDPGTRKIIGLLNGNRFIYEQAYLLKRLIATVIASIT